MAKSVNAVIDTGFTGFLSLPSSIVSELELPWSYRERATLGDGSETFFDIHDGSIIWDGQFQDDRCYALPKQDSRYPSLHFKKVGRFWSVRTGIHYRALAVEENDRIAWFWIGTHAEYDRFLRGR